MRHCEKADPSLAVEQVFWNEDKKSEDSIMKVSQKTLLLSAITFLALVISLGVQ